MVAAAVGPAGQHNLLAGVGGAQVATGVGAFKHRMITGPLAMIQTM
jgi:hypothetical protein